MRKQSVVLTELNCGECDCLMTIPRKVSKQKKPGHVKHMYCPMCDIEQPFIEGKRKDKKLMFWEQWHAQFE